MAITTQMRTDVANLYVALFGRAPERDGLGYWVQQLDAGKTVAQVAQEMYNTSPARATYPEFLTNEEVIGRFYTNVLGRTADAEGLAYWTAKLTAGQSKGSVIAEMITAVTSFTGTGDDALSVAARDSKALFTNKVTVGLYYAVDLGGNDVAAATAVLANVTKEAASVDAAKQTAGSSVGQTYALTIGADGFTGGSGNDTFVAAETTAATWSVGDVLNGGAGTDTLNITQTAAVTGVPTGATVTGIENVNVASGAAITLNTTSNFTGLTALTTSNDDAQTLTAAATTNVTATSTGVAGNDVKVTGGKDVTVTTTGATTSEINVTNAAGAVNVTFGGTFSNAADATNGDAANGAATIVGGSTVTVTQTSGAAAATKAADNKTVTQGAVKVTGTAATTAVTVTQDAAVTEVDGAGATGKIGVNAGAVTIADANAASLTAAGTITTVTLNNYGNSTIDSGALATVNLSGTGGTLGVTAGALTTAVVNTLALNLNGATMLAGGDNSVTVDADYKTLNIVGNTAASTLKNVTGTGVTTLNVSGDAKVTLTDNTFAALTSVVSTNTAGVVLGTTALGAAVSFTGGDGADSIILSNAFEKAITMGKGDDTVTYGGAASTTAGKVGSVAAGEGTDTIKMTAAQANSTNGASSSAAFNTAFTGFEVLDVTATTANVAVNLAGINGVNSAVARGIGAGNTLTLDGFANNGTLTLDSDAANATTSAYAANVTNAVLNANDSFNLVVKNSTAGSIDAGKVTVAGIETVNISTVDAGTTTDTAATQDTMVLVAADATKIVVSGNNGLDLTNTGNTKVTSFDASGVVANGTDDTAANLGVKFASANVTTTATVTIVGGDGSDVLTGAAAKDTITGGKGNDTLAGGTNADTINVGVGHDIINVASSTDATAAAYTDSGTALFDAVNGFKTVGTAITTAVDFTTQAKFLTTAAGNADLSILNITALTDDAGAGAGTAVDLAVEGNATGVGQAIGVTYTVKDGLVTLSGTGASAVDTLAEWLTEVAAVAATDGDVVAFQYGSDTYVFAQNGAQDVLVQLVGVTGTGLVEVTGGANITAAAGSILFGDSLA